MTSRATSIVPSLSFLATLLALALLAGACDDPPKAPEPSINVNEKQKELRDEVGEVQTEAKERADKVEAQLPEQDSGAAKDDAAPSQ
ncbi:hypothetical protein FIV42_03015 [Persicimonas caeni]|uniref:Secreted protein n=1 Tax=Persicimonas caeni TaxID=2292766 RepID=A0A4Y6PN55_PERCE|nr:hypothetical protein [Persicimonas caeni]QDG49741.1 hypothetical protein FIV42_03015 [Persicimonas caeni]QED30962.1 hypothetical protein FRD00_03010 [Persicimonas caeni]